MKNENKKIMVTGISAFAFGFLSGIILMKKTSSDDGTEDLPEEVSLEEATDELFSDLPDEIIPDDGVENLPDEVSLKDLEEGGNDNEEEKGNS